MENNWRQKSLENLEKNTWPTSSSEEDSYLVRTCNSLRKKQIQDFTTEDLRVMIGQGVGLYYLMPLVIEILTNNLFAEGDLYEGDLLKNVLDIDTKFWDDNKNYWHQLNDIFNGSRLKIEEMKFDTSKFDKCKHRHG